MTEPTPAPRTKAEPDLGLRRMLTWVLIALVAVVLLAIVVVELTLRAVGLR
jgi:hypothetical protein